MKRTEIRVWMVRNGVRGVDIARELGINHSVFSHWLAGRKTSARIVEHLRSLGCPEEYLQQDEADEAEAA